MEEKCKKYKNLSIRLGKENIIQKSEINYLKESKKYLKKRNEELLYKNKDLIN